MSLLIFSIAIAIRYLILKKFKEYLTIIVKRDIIK